jgi:hypothetical protein
MQVLPVNVLQPVHAPNTDPAAGSAVSSTTVPTVKGAEQPFPQSIPPGTEPTKPSPVPSRVSVIPGVEELKVAVTIRAAVIATVQVLVVPWQSPLHPPNVEPVAAAAVSVTSRPLG